MQVNIKALEKRIKESSITVSQLANQLGMDASTFYRKMNKKALSFSIAEMQSMVKALSMTQEEACHIFLEDNSHKCE